MELLEEKLRSRELAAALAARGSAAIVASSSAPSAAGGAPPAELAKLRERVRTLQHMLDAEQARSCDLQVQLDVLMRGPSPLTLASRSRTPHGW